MTSVPDFFQDDSEEALRSQVEWAGQQLGLGDDFFFRLLREDPRVFSAWRERATSLDLDKEGVLRDWWQTVLHLLSLQNFDPEQVRALLEKNAPAMPDAMRSAFSPPWSGSSLKEYLEDHGADALREVDMWVESFRFGDPYAPSREGTPWLSTPP
jgi:hypothetical protein